jgi:putative acetyltransferase
LIRPFAQEDQDPVVRIIRTVFQEYGFVFDLYGYDSDLLAIHERYTQRGGAFFVLEEEGRVIGCIGVTDEGSQGAEVHRLYLDPSVRGRSHGRRLLHHAIDWARSREKARVFLWSDVRLEHAHALYRREGFRQADERVCEDLEKSREYGFEKDL